MTNKELQNKTINELFAKGVIQARIDKLGFKNFIGRQTKIHEDVLQEVFFQLSKMDTDKFCDWLSRGKSNIEGLAVVIAQRQYMIHPKYPRNPNHSSVRKLLHTSSYTNLQQLNVTDVFEDSGADYKYLTLYEGDILENNEDDVFQSIYKQLTDEENYFLGVWMDNDGKERKICKELNIKTKEYREMKAEIFGKIKELKMDIKVSVEMTFGKRFKNDVEILLGEVEAGYLTMNEVIEILNLDSNMKVKLGLENKGE